MGRSKKREGRVSARRWREEPRGGSSDYLRMPEGVGTFEGKAGTYRLDFMSFIAGKGNPRAEAGEAYFERTFFVHKDVGPNSDWHLCLARTYKKPCPVCEYRAKLSSDPEADEKVIKALAPKERQLWLVKDLLNDPDSLLLWNVSYHLFGKQLKDKINNSDEEDGYDYFADPTEGKTMRMALQQSNNGSWTEVADIEFRSRKRQYDSEIINETPCLDKMLVPLSYDKFKALYLQTDEQKDEKDDEPRRRSRDDDDDKPRRRSRDDDDDEPRETRKADKQGQEISVGDSVRYRGGECEVVHVSGDGTSLVLEDSDGEIHKAIGYDDLDRPSEKRERQKSRDDDDDEPRRRSRRDDDDDKPKNQSRQDDDEGQDDWSESEESASKDPKPKDKGKSKSGGSDKDWDDW